MSKLILIDGDILVYSIGFSVEKSVYVYRGVMYKRKKGIAEELCRQIGEDPAIAIVKRKTVLPFQQAVMNLTTKMNRIFDDLQTKNYRMFLTVTEVEKNYRDEIATHQRYKGNRAGFEKPVYYKKIRDHLINYYKAEIISGQEADDAIGIEQYKIAKERGDFEGTIIASIDKDLRGLEGHHYHMNLGEQDYVDTDKALKYFYCQLMTGDSTDNIPGIYKLLVLSGRDEEAKQLKGSRYLKKYNTFALDHSPRECYNYVVDMYTSYGYGSTIINEIGDLLWIRREPDQIWSRDICPTINSL